MSAATQHALVACALSLFVLSCANHKADAPPDGAALFARHCASCHGRSGEGDGPVASVVRAAMPNLRTLSERNGGTFPRAAVTRYIAGDEVPTAHGDRLMPVWGDTFAGTSGNPQADAATARAALESLADFLEQIQY
jgi:mono/diheme cytochrome c family protein